MTIILGLIALSFLVVVHEAGHFIAARRCGVTVESFSVGMGPVILHKTFKGTDYRLSLIPFGGYCGLKGDKDFQAALDEKRERFSSDPTSFYGVHPFKRLCIAVMGPFFNALFAILAFTVIALIGYTYYSADNRIILADEIYPEITSAAREQGLKTGDRILFLDDVPIETFSDISRVISTHPDKNISALVERNEEIIELKIHPVFEKSSSLGKIGVLNWIDPVIADVPKESGAEKAGLQKGDIITAINGEPVFSSAQIFKLIGSESQARVTYQRGFDDEKTTVLNIDQSDEQLFSFEIPQHRSKTYSFFPAIAKGIEETGEMILLTFKSIDFLFKGADVSQAVSGPVRITVLLGDTVKTGFGAGINAGIVSSLNLLALISLSLFMMNLLPVPVLDGGTVLFSLIEIILRKPLKPKFLYYIQFVGIAFIGALIVLALFNDTRYLLFNRK